MKYVITILVALLAGLCLSAAPRYRVLKVRGNVEIEDHAGRRAAHVREAAGPATVFHIPDGASVALLDNETKAVYYSTFGGRTTARVIVREARKKADATTAAIGSAVLSSMSGSAAGTGAPKGVSHRGEDSPSGADLAVANAVRLGQGAGDMAVACEVVAGEDSVWHAVVVNRAGAPAYVNIAVCGAEPRLLLNVGYDAGMPCLLAGEGRTGLTQYTFHGAVPDSAAVVVCGEPFDVPAVNMLLKRGDVPDVPADAPLVTLRQLD